MARFLRVPQDSDIDSNSSGLMTITPIAGVAHDTIGIYTGPDSGDAEYIEQHRLAHFVVGEDEGEWEQQIDTEKFAAHANGANRMAFGIEFSRIESGMPLTDWQKRCWKVIREEAIKYHGFPDTYLDPMTVPVASVWVNGGNFRGWISHRSVMTDDATAQHTDWIPAADFILGDSGTVTEGVEEMPIFQTTNDGKKQFYRDAGGVLVAIDAELAAKLGPFGAGLKVVDLGGALGALGYSKATVEAREKLGLR